MKNNRAFSPFLFLLLLVTGLSADSTATDPDVSLLQLPDGVAKGNRKYLPMHSHGEVNVFVKLEDLPIATFLGKDAKTQGSKMSQEAQQSFRNELIRRQDVVMTEIRELGGRELGRLQMVLNGVIVTVDSTKVKELRTLPGVASVRPIPDYKLHLGETVPYIGATAVQNAGFDGSGVRVAILDDGVDYSHGSLLGLGTIASYDAAYGTGPTDRFIRREAANNWGD